MTDTVTPAWTLGASFQGTTIRPGGPRLRRRPGHLQRQHRPATGADRPPALRGRRGRRGDLRAGDRPPAVRALRRARRRGHVGGGRRRAHRPVVDEGRAGRPGPRHGDRAGGRAVGRVRPGRRAARRRHPGRPGDHHRGRRVLPRRRLRLAVPGVRPDLRQPGRPPTWSPPTAGWCGPARTRTPTCSGACAEPAPTSAWSRPTSCAPTRSRPRCWPGC